MHMRMVLAPHLLQALECSVCLELIECNDSKNLKMKVVQSGNDPMTVALFLIQAGCCPQCGTQLVSSGQTPDEVIARFNERLQEQLAEKA